MKTSEIEAKEWFEAATLGDVREISLAAHRVVLATAARAGRQSWGSQPDRAAVALMLPRLREALARTLLVRSRGARADLLVRALCLHGDMAAAELEVLDLAVLSPGNWRDLLTSGVATRSALLARLCPEGRVLSTLEEAACVQAALEALDAGGDPRVALQRNLRVTA